MLFNFVIYFRHPPLLLSNLKLESECTLYHQFFHRFKCRVFSLYIFFDFLGNEHLGFPTIVLLLSLLSLLLLPSCLVTLSRMFVEFSPKPVCPTVVGEVSRLWYSKYWEMHLRFKKLNLDIYVNQAASKSILLAKKLFVTLNYLTMCNSKELLDLVY